MRATINGFVIDRHPFWICGRDSSTRKLTLTESGERFMHAIRNNLEELQASIASVATDRGEPAGVLKLSMGLNFGAPRTLCCIIS